MAWAKAAATRWVEDHESRLPGFRGAYFAGSIATLPSEARFPRSSDVDVMVVLDGDPPAKFGKFSHDDVLLEITFLTRSLFDTPEGVLGKYHLAASFATGDLIADPSGELGAVQDVVRRDFAARQWVEARCADARNKVENGLQAPHPDTPLYNQVIGWAFPTGVLTHILLVAGLKNPTVRRRYEETRPLLEEYGHLDLYESLLGALGCVAFTPDQVTRHLGSVAAVFDAASGIADAPFPFASDISPSSRPIAIDGSREMIDRGRHREAVFWLVATYSRSLAILDHAGGAPVIGPYLAPYHRLLRDLGVETWDELDGRRHAALKLVPRVWAAAQDIIDRNPAIHP